MTALIIVAIWIFIIGAALLFLAGARQASGDDDPEAKRLRDPAQYLRDIGAL